MATKKAAVKTTAKKAPAKRATVVGSSRAQQAKWQAESDLSTLRQAEQIKGDARRLKAAQKEAQSQMDALASVTGKVVK